MVNAAPLPPLTLHQMPQTPSPTINTTVYDSMQKFLNLISSDQVIQVLLHCDRHNQVLDKWLVAIVYEYFQRAKFMLHQYSREKFFIALYLAIEFEEDEDRKVKDVLLDYMLQHDNIWTSKRQFVKKKDKFWRKIGFRCMVPRKRLEQIMQTDPYHTVWLRDRNESLGGANRSFSCKLDPPSYYKLQWQAHSATPHLHHQIPTTRDQLVARHRHQQPPPPTAPPVPQHQHPLQKVPELIDLTKDDSPPVPIKPHERKRTSAAYRHLHSIVKLIERDRGRRRPQHDLLKMKHAQQKRLSELQMLETLARTNSFSALNTDLAHLNMNNSLSAAQNCLSQLQYAASNNYNLFCNPDTFTPTDFNIPGLILLPDRRMSLPMLNLDHLAGSGGVPSPNLPMVVPVVPRQDHWV